MSFYYAYVLQLAGTCSNWCQTLLMKGAWAMKLMCLKDVLPSGRAASWGLFFTFLSRTSGSSVCLRRGSPLRFTLPVPWVSFPAVMRPPGLESFTLKQGVMREFWQREQGFVLFSETRRSQRQLFILGGKKCWWRKKKNHEGVCSKECSPRHGYRSKLHTILLRMWP